MTEITKAETVCSDGSLCTDVRCDLFGCQKPKMMLWGDLFGATSSSWVRDCYKWRGEVLLGSKAHWCREWDDLPVDETTSEFDACTCYDK